MLPLRIIFQTELAFIFSPDMAMLTEGLKTRSFFLALNPLAGTRVMSTLEGATSLKGLVHCEKRLRISGLFSSIL